MNKTSFILAALLMAAAPLFAQEQDYDTDVNQYGQTVHVTPLRAEQQDGILVLQNKSIGYKFWFDVRVQGDAAVYWGQDKDFNPIGNGASMRRTRFAVKAMLDKNWYGELDTDWTSGVCEIKDAYIEYLGIPNFSIQAGNFKENFAIQRNTTSRYLQFMERPMIVTLAPSRHMGINATYDLGYLWSSLGVFGPEVKGAEEMTCMEDNNKDFGHDEGLSITGKLVGRPLYKSSTSGLHIGAAVSYRQPKASSTDGFAVARYSSRNSTNINRKKYLDTDDMKGMDHELAYTFELAGHHKGLRYEGAYLARSARFNPAVNDIGPQTAWGWYAQAGYLLFGGRQNYDAFGAKYTRVNRGGKCGDIELCARYEYCDFNTTNYLGGSAEAYTIGLNFYLSNNVKLVINYQYNNNDRFANGKGKLLVGHDANGVATKDYTKVVEAPGKGGVDYSMLACRFEVAF
jgi:phosphate-selective porin OprO/OprP